MYWILSSSVSLDAAYGEGQTSVDGEDHWTQRSESQAVKDPHQPSQAGWCKCQDKPLIFSFVFDNLITVYCNILTTQSPLKKLMKKREELEEEPPEKEELDWWSRYYSSLEELERKVMAGKKNKNTHALEVCCSSWSPQYNIEHPLPQNFLPFIWWSNSLQTMCWLSAGGAGGGGDGGTSRDG